MLLLLTGCAALIQGSVGATYSPILPPQGNVNLQVDAGFSPAEAGEILDEGEVGFGLSARARVDDKGQMNDIGVHAFAVGNAEGTLRPYGRATLFALAQYDTEAELLAPGLGVRMEGGLLVCPGEDEGFYCATAQLQTEYDGWFGGERPPFWIGASVGVAVNWGEGF